MVDWPVGWGFDGSPKLLKKTILKLLAIVGLFFVALAMRGQLFKLFDAVMYKSY